LVESWALAGLRLKNETNEVFGGIGYEHLVWKRERVGLDALVPAAKVSPIVIMLRGFTSCTHVVLTSLVSKGGLPTSMVYKMTPTLHTSTS
jgi:hypothetical protein